MTTEAIVLLVLSFALLGAVLALLANWAKKGQWE